ncbi:MAG TPA: hypothetical protein VM008_11115 [Phycisphaerae bacterium]|nr:hypothetical protein [Phycisphaerae bacterium]
MAIEDLVRQPHYYATSFNDRSGFVIVKEASRCLLWITLNGGAECFPCNGLRELFRILERDDIRRVFAADWQQEPASEQPFEEMWQSVLAEARDVCASWDIESLPVVPDRVMKQLLWAFDASGKLDGDRFETILKHERVNLTTAQMIELASELTGIARRAKFAINAN